MSKQSAKRRSLATSLYEGCEQTKNKFLQNMIRLMISASEQGRGHSVPAHVQDGLSYGYPGVRYHVSKKAIAYDESI